MKQLDGKDKRKGYKTEHDIGYFYVAAPTNISPISREDIQKIKKFLSGGEPYGSND